MAPRSAIIVLLAATGLVGCVNSHGFNRTAMSDTLQSIPMNHQPHQLAAPRLSMPFHLGVVFVHRTLTPSQPLQPVEWLPVDGDILLRSLTPLQDEQILADTFVLIDTVVPGESIDAIKQAGVQSGADAVLIVDAVSAVDRYNNGYASLYPTILGAYLAPGTESSALVMVSGTLWDVRSDWHTPIEAAEGKSKAVGSAFMVEDRTAVAEAKDTAIETFGKRVAERLWLMSEELPRVGRYLRRIEPQEHSKQE